MNPAAAEKAHSLVRPTVDTKFHIDSAWWTRADRELEVYLIGQLCPEHQAAFADMDSQAVIDVVDPESGEVHQMPGIQHVLITHCAKQPDYLTPQTSLVNAVFRLFLANGNAPLSPAEMQERLGKPANTILRTLSSPRVYKGIRPYVKD